MLGLLGKKLGQTRVYDAKGVVHSVTVVAVGPNRVIEVEHGFADLAGIGFELTAPIERPGGKIVGITGNLGARLGGQGSPA